MFIFSWHIGTFVLSRFLGKFLDFHIFVPTFLLADHHATSVTTCIYWSAGTCGRLARVKESTAVNHQLITPGRNWRALTTQKIWKSRNSPQKIDC